MIYISLLQETLYLTFYLYFTVDSIEHIWCIAMLAPVAVMTGEIVEVNHVPKKKPKLWTLMMCCGFTVVSSLVSLVLNVFLVRAYYIRMEYWFFSLTLLLWISGKLASIVEFVFMDCFGRQEYKARSLPLSILLIAILGPGYMNIEARISTYKFKLIRNEVQNENYEYYQRRSQKYNDQAPISDIIAICFEGGPQMVLQLYVFLSCFLRMDLKCVQEILIQYATLKYLKCLFSTVNTVAKHGERFREKDQVAVDKCCFCCNVRVLLNFIGYLFLIQSRNISLALLAKVNKQMLAAFVLIHWICFTIWFVVKVRKTDSQYYRFHWVGCNKLLEAVVKCFRLMAPGVVSIFIFPFYLNRQLQIRYGYLIFYIIYFLEGAAMVLYWYFMDEEIINPTHEFSYILTLESIIRYFYFFVVGFAFLVIQFYMDKSKNKPQVVTYTTIVRTNNAAEVENACTMTDVQMVQNDLPKSIMNETPASVCEQVASEEVYDNL